MRVLAPYNQRSVDMKSFAYSRKPCENRVNLHEIQAQDPSRRRVLRGALAIGYGLLVPAALLGCDKKTETDITGSVPPTPGDTSGANMVPGSTTSPAPDASTGEAPSTESAAPAAPAKASQASVQYQNQPKGEQKCANCMHFVGPNACKVVEGEISPEGWCLIWVKQT